VLIDNVGVNTLVDYNIAEFFILQKYRRKGVGTYVAQYIFDRFRGNWEVMQALSHKAAQMFWRKVIAQYTSGNYEESIEVSKNHGGDWAVQSFNNKDRK
jgi:predicted acetyltransferase